MLTPQQIEWTAAFLNRDQNELLDASPGVVGGADQRVYSEFDTTSGQDLSDHVGDAPGGPPTKFDATSQAKSPPAEDRKQPAEAHGKEEGKTGGEKGESGKEGEAKEESKDSGIAVAVLQLLTSKADGATLVAQVGSAMPKGKTEDDFKWKGPVNTYADYPEEMSTLHLTTIAYAQVEISFYYSGKYIRNFHAKLTKADLDKSASMHAKLEIDDTNVNSPDGIAHLDWTVTFERGHWFGSKTVTVTGRANGDGTYETSQPSIADLIDEDRLKREAEAARAQR